MASVVSSWSSTIRSHGRRLRRSAPCTSPGGAARAWSPSRSSLASLDRAAVGAHGEAGDVAAADRRSSGSRRIGSANPRLSVRRWVTEANSAPKARSVRVHAPSIPAGSTSTVRTRLVRSRRRSSLLVEDPGALLRAVGQRGPHAQQRVAGPGVGDALAGAPGADRRRRRLRSRSRRSRSRGTAATSRRAVPRPSRSRGRRRCGGGRRRRRSCRARTRRWRSGAEPLVLDQLGVVAVVVVCAPQVAERVTVSSTRV